MKLQLNAKELLALHNVLYERFESGVVPNKWEDNSERSSADTQLFQVYNRLKSCIVNGLTGCEKFDPLEAFLQQEQVKIDQLKVDLKGVKAEQAELGKTMVPEDLVEDDKDFFIPDYPRRVAGATRQGKHRQKQ